MTLLNFNKTRPIEKANIFKIALCLILLFAARQEALPNPAVHLDRINKIEGFSHSYFHVLFLDTKGFAWIGTTNGLCRFDGTDYVVFKKKPFVKNSIADNTILNITEDRNGCIWAATISGLSKIEPKTGFVKNYSIAEISGSKASNAFECFLFNDSSYTIWYIYNGNIKYYDEKTDSFVKLKTGNKKIDRFFLNKEVTFLGNSFVDINFNIYLIFLEHKKQKNKLVTKNHLITLNKERQFKAHFEMAGDLELIDFVGEKYAGKTILRLKHKTGKLEFKEVDLLRNKINPSKLELDPEWLDKGFMVVPFIFEKGLYLKVFHNKLNSKIDVNEYIGLYDYGDEHYMKFDKKYQLYKYQTNTYFQNEPKCRQLIKNKSSYWDLTHNEFLKFNTSGKNINTYRNDPGDNSSLSDDQIRSIICDNMNNIWVAGVKSVNKFDNEKKKWLRFYLNKEKDHNILGNRINILYEDADGRILCGTSNGIYYLEEANLKLKPYLKINPNKSYSWYSMVWSILRDDRSNLWVGTMESLYKYDKYNKLIKAYKLNSTGDSINNNQIWKLYQDSKYRIWAGTNEGLFKYIPQRDEFKPYKYDVNNKSSICGEKIWSIIEDKNNNLWIGAHGSGISRLVDEKGKFESFTTSDGMTCDGIMSMAADASNNIWLSTDDGLIKFNPENNSCIKFTEADGLQGNIFSFHSAAATKNGEMVFGGMKGVSIFNPDDLKSNSNSSIIVSKVQIGDSIVSLFMEDKEKIYSNWDDGYIKIQISSLDYNDHVSGKFRYKLEGFNKDWVNIGSESSIAFSGLAPGEYILRIKKQNHFGYTDDKGIVIYLNVKPPYWLTGWFRIIIITLALLIAVTILYIFLKRKKEKEIIQRKVVSLQLKAIQSQMNPHFMFNCLNSILNLIMQGKTESSMEYLSKFSNLLRKILHNSRAVNIPLEEAISQLTLYLELELLRFKNKFSYKIRIDDDIELKEVKIPSLLLQPYVENSIKHGKIYDVDSGFVEVNIRKSGNHIVGEIVDNGIGRERAALINSGSIRNHQSMGTELTEERLNLLGAKVSIVDLMNDSGEPKGTKVEFAINLENLKNVY